MGWNLQFISFDFEFEKFFPKGDPDSQFYEIHKEQFGYDNDFLLIILESPEIFDQGFLQKVKEFEDSLTNLEFVARVASPISRQHLVNGPAGLFAFPLLHIDKPQVLRQDSIRIFSNPLYQYSFGKDRKSLLISINHFHFADQESSRILVDQIEGLAATVGLNKVRMVGKLTAQNEFIDLIQSDFAKFLVGSIILSLSLLLFIFKNLKTALLPFLISFFSLIWLFGLIGFLGIKINLLSSLLPPIIFFSSMSDAVHLLNAIYKSKKSTLKDRLKESVSIVWIPTLLTSVTTAIGFLSLLLINTEPIQILGLFAACGILIAFIITFSFGIFASSFIPIKVDRKVVQIPQSFQHYLLNNRNKVAAFMILVILILVPGISQLKINAYLLDDLPKDSQVRSNFEYADSYLGGSKPYEMRIDTKDSLTVWDKGVMDEILKIEEYLTSQYPIARVQSPSIILKYLNQVNHGGLNENFLYPGNDKNFQKAVSLTRRIEPDLLRHLISEDQRACRIVGFFPEYGSYETTVRNEKMLEFLKRNIDHSKISYRITGTTFLIDKSHELLSKNLLLGLFIAIVIIGTILGLYFRSIKLLIISLIPNIVPLLIVAGVLGWLGISLKMTTAIIFTIAFGIAVDDTIHMMSYYVKNEISDRKEALQATFFHAGSAMLITSIIMIAGFSLFLLSEFGATYYLGLFISLSLLVALLVDITILPILLLSIKKKDAKNR
ncbi:MAG: efflux RND transporter permease subunit [Cyclobacteriaceae bacterium]